MSRYLTPDEKERIVAGWLAYRDTCRGPGGYGYPDPDIFPLTDVLNSFDGLCTLQSCSGHIMRNPVDDAEYIQPAHLWLVPAEYVFHRFGQLADELAASPLIDAVRVLYGVHPWPVIDVEFHGNERGRLAESSELVAAFFTRIITQSSGIVRIISQPGAGQERNDAI